MSPFGSDNAPRPFTPAELDGVDDAALEEMLAIGRIARELEAVAERGGVRPSADFADRVMRAVASEPSPAPVRAAGSALRHHSLAGLLVSFRDAVRVSLGAGFPMAVRGQAMALVLVVGLFAAGSSAATAGAISLIRGPEAAVVPVVPATPVPTEAVPTPYSTLDPWAMEGSPDPTDLVEPSPSPSVEPSGSPEPTRETPEPVDTSIGGSGGSGAATTKPSHRPTPTPSPTESEHHDPHAWPHPSASPSPSPSLSPSPLPSPSL